MHDDLRLRLQEALGDGYAVERPLGAGGFAVVFRVRDVQLGRALAVKVLDPDVVASRIVRERFRREAEVVAQLSHPHIVPLHFIGQRDDLVWIAMACIDGGSLADRLAHEAVLPPAEAARLLREVASALDHAHRRGIIHRDIKPANILLDRETGRALVTDFGIARTAESGTLTSTGLVVGTPAYLSPEQVTGEGADHRADLYALGVMGYEMLAGALPFGGANTSATLLKRLAGPPPALATIRADVPGWLSDIVQRCLDPAPEGRFATASEVVRALEGGSAGATLTASAPRATGGAPRRSLPLVVGGVALLGVLALLASRREGAGDGATRAAPVAVPAKSASAAAASTESAGRAGGIAGRPAVPEGMVVVAGGAYPIGDDAGPALARPRHVVTLAAFALDRTEVTIEAYRVFAEARTRPLPWTGRPDPRRPVTGVGAADAEAFCGWRVPGGRLPTELEWEAAARGLDGRAYPWGEGWDPTRANVPANSALARQRGPLPVGGFPSGATPEGVLDLIGNVWEWTGSVLAAYPGGTVRSDGEQFRVIRGGAYNSTRETASSSYRGYQRPTSATPRADYAGTGFRCAASLPVATPR